MQCSSTEACPLLHALHRLFDTLHALLRFILMLRYSRGLEVCPGFARRPVDPSSDSNFSSLAWDKRSQPPYTSSASRVSIARQQHMRDPAKQRTALCCDLQPRGLVRVNVLNYVIVY